jgi:hypothetical protein
MNTVRDFSPTILVAALGTTFGSALVIAPGIVTEALRATGLSDVASVKSVLDVVGWLFLGIALYVGAIVTANTCATLIAGQTRIIALQRLVGATGATLRSRITRAGLVVGVIGGLIGVVVGTGLSALFVAVLRGNGFLPDTSYTLVPWQLVLPVVAVVLATWGAFAVGSRRVLTVTPLQALSSVVEPSHDDVKSGLARKVWAILLMAGGAALMLLGLLLSSGSPVAVFPAALGGFISFAGVAVGATIVMPPVLSLIGRIGAKDPVVLLAGRNALRAPGRASRATIGLVIGVTLLVTFAVALGMMQHVLEEQLRAQFGGGGRGRQRPRARGAAAASGARAPACAGAHRGAGPSDDHHRGRPDGGRGRRHRAGARHGVRLGRRADAARVDGVARSARAATADDRHRGRRGTRPRDRSHRRAGPPGDAGLADRGPGRRLTLGAVPLGTAPPAPPIARSRCHTGELRCYGERDVLGAPPPSLPRRGLTQRPTSSRSPSWPHTCEC